MWRASGAPFFFGGTESSNPAPSSGESDANLTSEAKLQAQRPALPEGLRLGAGEREDYTYNRTR